MRILLAILFSVSLAPAASIGILSGSPPAAAGGADVAENFEGTGTPGGWTVSLGSPNFDQATTGLSLEASQCLYITAEAGAENAYVSFTASDTAYAYFLLRVENIPGGAARTQFRFTDSSGNTLVEQALDIGPLGFYVYDTAIGDKGDGFPNADTTYHIWFEYVKGTGANAIVRLYFSTDGTKPGSPDAQLTNANATAQAARFYFGIDWTGSAGDVYFDKLRISRTTVFGNSPP